jgi:signal-transduction protein with cAMP-binding, CBS, and nucleotidyltransferase domain
MSPRAASRLESLGFSRVYDYVAGKADWGSSGLPLEGRADGSTRVLRVVATDVPTCRLDELVPDVAARLPDGWDICIVTNEDDIVLGVLGRRALRSDQQATAEDAMTAGPSTIRPSARLKDIAIRMRDQNLTRTIVTRSDGVLLGVLRVEDIEPTYIPS